MTVKTIEPAKGHLLISVPFLNDQFFGRSVVLLTEHHHEGSVGFILNKPLETKVSDAITDFPEFDSVLHVGGPVDNNSLFYVHVLGNIIPDSIEIMKGLYWGGDFEYIKQMISFNKILPSEIRFFVGYSGWGADQLNREIKENSWLIQKSNPKIVMNTDTDNFWKYFIKKTDKKYAVWADFPVNPSLN